MRRIAWFVALCAAGALCSDTLLAQYPRAQGLLRAHETQIRGWYRDYLGREAGAELSAWVQLMDNGMSPLDVQAWILGSDEAYIQKGRDAQGFILETLQGVTWQEPTSAEMRRWTNRLAVLHNDRFVLAREILLEYNQADSGTIPAGPTATDVAQRLVTAGRLLIDTIDFEIGGTLQGGQASLKAKALYDAADRLRRIVAVTAYRPTDAALALQNVDHSFHALQTTLNHPSGTAPSAGGIVRRISALLDEANTAIYPPTTAARPTPGPALGKTAQTLLAQTESASRGVDSIIQSLTSQAYQKYSYGVVLRDLDTLAVRLDEFDASIRRGSSRERLQWEIQSLAEQALRIGPALLSGNPPAFTRLFWSSVESSLEQLGETLGVATGESTVLRPTPAMPTLVPLVDQSISRVDVFLTGTQPLVFGVPEVPRVQRDVKAIRSRLLELRQQTQENQPASALLDTLTSMVADYQRAYGSWGQIVTRRNLLNPPRLSPVGDTLNEVERILKEAVASEDLTPGTGSASTQVARQLETMSGVVRQYRETLPPFVRYNEHAALMQYCNQLDDYLSTLQALQQDGRTPPDTIRRQAAGLQRQIGQLSATTDSLDARVQAVFSASLRSGSAALRGHVVHLRQLADALESELY
ncbi:MAG: hypothetical protein WD872_17230 [Pirellulaceae bacterium]